jgi:lipopolysaccharide transport system ATP-binding protein
MSSPVIAVEGLSKKYNIGAARSKDDGLRHTIENVFRNPARFFRKSLNGAADLTEFWALKDLNFEVNPGQVLGVVGRNGAGKSTLLKVLSRITEPTEGNIRLRGRVASLLEVGTGFHPELTGRENIYLNGAILGMSRVEIKRKFEEIVEFAEVARFLDTPVKRYSSGMYVRLAFAVAAHLEPEILIVDEVLAVGDAEFQKKCIGKMEDVSENQGRTVIVVSHQMPVIQSLCNRCLFLEKGELVQEGATRDIVNRYLAKSTELAATALVAREDRQGKGDVVATNLEILDEELQVANECYSGQRVTFRIHFKAKPGVVIKNGRISLAVVKDGKAYFCLANDLADNRSLELRDEGTIDLIVPDLPLSGGDYSLSTFISAGEQVQDWVDDALLLRVSDGDFYGSGKLYHTDWQGRAVHVHHSWQQVK